MEDDPVLFLVVSVEAVCGVEVRAKAAGFFALPSTLMGSAPSRYGKGSVRTRATLLFAAVAADGEPGDGDLSGDSKLVTVGISLGEGRPL